jgi:Bacterial virulence protein (VirJ)
MPAPTIPALASIDLRMIQCFYREDESDSVCPELRSNGVEIIRVGSSHHFGGDYDALAQDILAGVSRRGIILEVRGLARKPGSTRASPQRVYRVPRVPRKTKIGVEAASDAGFRRR